ncbi:MAG: hypothetical protein ACYS26_18620 [Planctomycetota bacterium]|jgi:hypothetical protein
MNDKNHLKTLALSTSKQNLFLALTLSKGLGFEVEEVLEWWWEEEKRSYESEGIGEILEFGVGGLECFFCPVQIEILDEYWDKDISIRVFPNPTIRDSVLGLFMFKDLPPLPTIIKNIKDYTFALIRHLWEFGEEEVE